jgi:hypothetical protein
MPAYMYPIVIKREPQKVRYTKEIELKSDSLTLAKLRKLVTEEETFSISQEENSIYGSKTVLYIHGERLETDKELKTRVLKEEIYMRNYTEFQKKHNPNK